MSRRTNKFFIESLAMDKRIDDCLLKNIEAGKIESKMSKEEFAELLAAIKRSQKRYAPYLDLIEEFEKDKTE